MNILYEDSHIIVCEKPVGVPSQSNRSTDFDMVNQLKKYIWEQTGQVNPYLGLIHRLDRPVGGIMVFAKTTYAAKELSRQVQERIMKKHYVAIVSDDLSNEIGSQPKRIENYLVKNNVTNLSKITTAKDKNAKKAILDYQVISTIWTEEYGKLSLVEIELLTGRHHQIRVQLSQISNGIWGDTKYNKEFQNQKEWSNVALYAYSLSFIHPKTKKILCFSKMTDVKPFSLFEDELKKLGKKD